LKRLAVAWLAAGAMALVALPVLVVAAGEALDGVWGIPRVLWLVIFGLVLAAAAGLTAWLAWRHFQRQFRGLEETLEELREDAVWLQEWTGRDG
jgi:NhaP-type Na+/H+ or K+/H+ antiporter